MTGEQLLGVLAGFTPFTIEPFDLLVSWLLIGVLTYGVLWMFDLSSLENQRHFAAASLVVSLVVSMLFLSMVGAFEFDEEGTATRQVWSFWMLFSLAVFIIPYLIYLYKNRKTNGQHVADREVHTMKQDPTGKIDMKLYNHEAPEEPWNQAQEVPKRTSKP